VLNSQFIDTHGTASPFGIDIEFYYQL